MPVRYVRYVRHSHSHARHACTHVRPPAPTPVKRDSAHSAHPLKINGLIAHTMPHTMMHIAHTVTLLREDRQRAIRLPPVKPPCSLVTGIGVFSGQHCTRRRQLAKCLPVACTSWAKHGTRQGHEHPGSAILSRARASIAQRPGARRGAAVGQDHAHQVGMAGAARRGSASASQPRARTGPGAGHSTATSAQARRLPTRQGGRTAQGLERSRAKAMPVSTVHTCEQ